MFGGYHLINRQTFIPALIPLDWGTGGAAWCLSTSSPSLGGRSLCGMVWRGMALVAYLGTQQRVDACWKDLPVVSTMQLQLLVLANTKWEGGAGGISSACS